jgi:hypothetical protein
MRGREGAEGQVREKRQEQDPNSANPFGTRAQVKTTSLRQTLTDVHLGLRQDYDASDVPSQTKNQDSLSS